MHEPAHEESGFLDYWQILLRRRWIVILATASALLISVVASFLATPLYRATATLQIERRSPDILTFRDLSQLDYSWTAYSDFYQTQYKLLASEPVSRRAAERLGLAEHPAIVPREPGRPRILARLRGMFPARRTTAPLLLTQSSAARVDSIVPAASTSASALPTIHRPSRISDLPEGFIQRVSADRRGRLSAASPV